jgi:hypothetical protein
MSRRGGLLGAGDANRKRDLMRKGGANLWLFLLFHRPNHDGDQHPNIGKHKVLLDGIFSIKGKGKRTVFKGN